MTVAVAASSDSNVHNGSVKAEISPIDFTKQVSTFSNNGCRLITFDMNH